MKTQRNLVHSAAEYSHHYANMRGVDFSIEGNGTSRNRFCDLLNMYRDWDGDGMGATESIPGFRILSRIGSRITNIYLQKTADSEYLIVCATDGIYRLAVERRDEPDALKKLLTTEIGSAAGFAFGEDFYLLINCRIWRVNAVGEVHEVGDGKDVTPYIPTTYHACEAFEQRNVLTLRFKEEYVLSSVENMRSGTDGLLYRVLDRELGTCRLMGRETCTSPVLYVPASVTIGNRVYTVVGVGDRAFEGDVQLEEITLPDTVTEVGYHAFSDCTNLHTFLSGEGIVSVLGCAFNNCTALTKVYFGAALETLGIGVFLGCNALQTVYCSFPSSQLSRIENRTELSGLTVVCDYLNPRAVVDVPVFSAAASIDRVQAGGEDLPFLPIYDGQNVSAVRIDLLDKRPYLGATITLHGSFHEGSSTDPTVPPSYETIAACTVAEAFDGRIFLAGNPAYPNTVFYSARGQLGINDPTYFGILNYFNDGIGRFPVVSLLAVGGNLAVFKADDDGTGSIFYHTPTETGENLLPKIYPTSYVHSGICAFGAALSFFDDPVFVSESGISAIEKSQLNSERSIACRSHNVNIRLLSEDLPSIKLAKWRGYLVVLAGKNVYLADSRQIFRHDTGALEYEWYFLSGIGTHTDDERVFRYASDAPLGYEVHEQTDEVAEGVVYSTEIGGAPVYYTEDRGVRYAVYKTDELRGGTFHEASVLCSVGDLLFFGTENGDLCLFNSDKRGTPPTYLAESADFDPEAYRLLLGNRIHPCFYSFAGHAPVYKLLTPLDNCGVPHLTKNSVKGSLVLKCRATGAVRMICEVGTDRSGYRELTSFPGGVLDFSEACFLTLSYAGEEYFTVPILESERSWIEKQIGILCEEFASPIALISISYRYRIKGKIRKQ